MAEGFGKVLPYRSGWRLALRPYGYLYTDQGLHFESEAHAVGVLASIRREIANGAAASDIVRRPPSSVVTEHDTRKSSRSLHMV